ncbi:MAG TPA: ABC transporter permease [Thermomicrobiaceae bacterium]|nr:ABC transporter permease [Thermomicrobiaceae bacterium]
MTGTRSAMIPIQADAADLSRKPRSLWTDVLHQLLRNKGALAGAAIFVLIVIMAVAAPLIAPYAPYKLSVEDSLLPPNAQHWMGTDQFGRDILTRVIYGARTSVAMGFVAVAISVTTGTVLGLISGYYRGAIDMVVMRAVDVMLAFPGILLALVIIAILGPNLSSAMIAVGISGMPLFIRVVRGSVLSLRELEYLEAARVVGSRDSRILLRHVLPNVLAPVIVLATLGIPGAIISGAALSFLGLGVKPPTADWGAMLSEGRNFINAAWWLSTFPGLAIVVIVMAINLFGDGMRDALDPRLRL